MWCRLADTQQTAAADASAALALSLPLLIDKGLQCRSASVRDAAVSTLASIVAVAAPHEIAAQLAPLIAALLEALSTLEANAFNVLDMHADRLGVDRNTLEEKRVQVRCPSPLGSYPTTLSRVKERTGPQNNPVSQVSTVPTSIESSTCCVNGCGDRQKNHRNALKILPRRSSHSAKASRRCYSDRVPLFHRRMRPMHVDSTVGAHPPTRAGGCYGEPQAHSMHVPYGWEFRTVL